MCVSVCVHRGEIVCVCSCVRVCVQEERLYLCVSPQGEIVSLSVCRCVCPEEEIVCVSVCTRIVAPSPLF